MVWYQRNKEENSFFNDYPHLKPFILEDVEFWSTIGAGSSVRIDKAVIPVSAAARILHDASGKIELFVKECELMSTIQHPNVVQFLGIAFRPVSSFPALTMEQMSTSLHDLLETEGEKVCITFYDQKFSVLQNVACGLTYLHERSPSVIHRDLSAANILLTSEMVAKIADFGSAHVMKDTPEMLSDITGNTFYMPPEAIPIGSSHTIDIFSFGVVTIFTFAEEFPNKLLAATYLSKEKMVVARTEVERRHKYIDKVEKELSSHHPILALINQCLHMDPEERPNAPKVLEDLESLQSPYRVRKLHQILTGTFKQRTFWG